jgi:hypothetical protein
MTVASFNENRKFTFFALNTDGNRLNHAVVVHVIARTDIDEIKVEPVLLYCKARKVVERK